MTLATSNTARMITSVLCRLYASPIHSPRSRVTIWVNGRKRAKERTCCGSDSRGMVAPERKIIG
jgi:hypothetical protein